MQSSHLISSLAMHCALVCAVQRELLSDCVRPCRHGHPADVQPPRCLASAPAHPVLEQLSLLHTQLASVASWTHGTWKVLEDGKHVQGRHLCMHAQQRVITCWGSAESQGRAPRQGPCCCCCSSGPHDAA